MYIPVEFKKMHPNAKIPTRATAGAAAFDLYAVEKCTIMAGSIVKIRTGIGLAIPEDFEVLITLRSSAVNHGIVMPNGVGIIDSDYRGELFVGVYKLHCSNPPFELNAGDRFAQMRVQPSFASYVHFKEVDDFSTTTARGAGGFGSSG